MSVQNALQQTYPPKLGYTGHIAGMADADTIEGISWIFPCLSQRRSQYQYWNIINAASELFSSSW